MKFTVICSTSVKFEILMAVQIYILTWALSPCTLICGYQHFWGTCCFHLQSIPHNIILKLETTHFSLKSWCLSAKRHGFTSLMTIVLVQITCLLFPLGVMFEVFVVVKMWIVVIWNCDIMEEKVFMFRVVSIFGLQDGDGIFLWKIDNCLWNHTLSVLKTTV